MNDRSGLMTLAAFAVAAMVLGVAAFWGIFRYGAMGRVSALGPAPPEPPRELAVTGLQLPPNSRSASANTQMDYQRIQVLESMLAEKTALVRQQAQRLIQQTAELEETRQRFDDAMLAVEALQGFSSESLDPLIGNALDEEVPETDPPTDLDKLGAELTLAREIHDAMVGDLDALQKELDKAYDEIEGLREDADAVLTRQLQDAMAMETASAGILLQVGREAVPALADALAHANPMVRRWAATVLGGIGQDAEEATGALVEALSDSDPGVRQAAKAALDAIER